MNLNIEIDYEFIRKVQICFLVEFKKNLFPWQYFYFLARLKSFIFA